MTEQGWWQASDGKWYPPESRPVTSNEHTTATVSPPPPTATALFCSGCGNQLSQSTGFCPSCGRAIGVLAAPVSDGSPGKGFAIAGLVCGIIALLLLPILLGPLGVIFGSIAWSKGSKFGMVATVVTIPCMVLGMLFGLMVWSAL